MTLKVLALQAKKDCPTDPRNKIAFTLDGHLCFVTDPEAAHSIIKAAEDELIQLAHEDWLACKSRDWPVASDHYRKNPGALSTMTARVLARHSNLSEIAKRA